MIKSTAQTSVKNPNIIHKIKHSPNHHTKLAKGLKTTILVAFAMLILIVGVGVYYWLHLQATPKNDSAKNQAVELLNVGDNNVSHTITSTFGFSLKYANPAFQVSGQVTDPASTGTYISGEGYKDKELETSRAYSLVKFQLPGVKNGQFLTMQPELSVITNIRKDYWTNKEALPEYKGKSHSEILVQKIISDEAKNKYTVESQSDQAINGTTYKKIQFIQSDANYGVTTKTRDIYYLTVQNDRPYIVSIQQVTEKNGDVVPQFEAVINTLDYFALKDGLLSRNQAQATTASVALTLPSGTSNIPSVLDADTILKVVANNQPAVVRIGTSYCADIELLLPDGSVGATLTNACTGGVGSGSIVSNDGYIATNGHVTRATPRSAISGYLALANDKNISDRLKIMLNYLVDAHILTPTQIEQLITGLKAGDASVITKLSSLGTIIPKSSIRIKSDHYNYAVQTSNEPMKADFSNGFSFKYTKTVLKADFIAADINMASLDDELYVFGDDTSGASDVSILKMKGAFPIVKLGSIDNLKPGDKLTAIGYPGFVDDALSTTKTFTVPSITQGTIQSIDIQSETNSHVLVVTTVPIGHGSSGGPALDKNGQEVGLNTYGNVTCPDQKCFGAGTARNIADYKSLLSKNNVSLATTSTISDDWSRGITAFVSGDYRSAVANFKSSQASYPANYLASKFIDLAESKVGTPGDISSDKQTISIVFIAGIAVALVVVASIVALIMHFAHHSGQVLSQSVGSYGPPPMPLNITPAQLFQPTPPVQPNAGPLPQPISPPEPTSPTTNDLQPPDSKTDY